MLAFGFPATAIVAGALCFEAQGMVRRVAPLLFVGDISYSIYLVHIFPIAVLRAGWGRLHLGTSEPAALAVFLLLSIAGAIACAAVSYYLIEKSSLRYLHRVIRRHGRQRRADGSLAS